MMNDVTLNIEYTSLSKHQEELCGDYIEVQSHQEDTKVIVLSDGLGSGVKANILSTLSAKMISTMLSKGVPIEECLDSIAHTLPICKVRGLAYSTFTILHIKPNQQLEIINYDNPEVILLRDGKQKPLVQYTRILSDKRMTVSQVQLQENDVIIAMSDGCIHAGVGETLNYGWQHENIVLFLENMYIESYSAKALTKLLIDECNQLYKNKPGDDTTVLCLKVKKKEVINILIGPPEDKHKDLEMLELFFSKKGKHIVCGGTTSQMVSKYLKKPLNLTLNYEDMALPPTASIEGVDLVTEGILTISKLLEIAKDYTADNETFNTWLRKKDGASMLAHTLFEEATNINFFIGKAVNPAHQNPKLPINFSIKMQLIETLINHLKKMHKEILVNYF